MINKLAIAVLFALTGLGIGATEAHAANWTIRIDNRANPDIIPNWATNDDIRISIRTASSVSSGYDLAFENTISSALDFTINDSVTPLSSVLSATVYINGIDMFVIDQFIVLDTNGNTYYTSGVDNSVGYCLSEDSDDYDNNPECLNGTGDRDKTFYF